MREATQLVRTFFVRAALLVGPRSLTRSIPPRVHANCGQGYERGPALPDYRPPTWPDGDVPKQIHLDLAVDDLDRTVAEAERLGANVGEIQPAPERWRVLFDPAGHPFCLTTQIPPEAQ